MTPAEQVVRRYLDCVNAGDAAGIAALFAPEAWLRPPMGGELQGPDAVRRMYERTFRTRTVRAVPTSFITEGDRCVVCLSTTVDDVNYEFIDVFTMGDDGLIQEMVAYRRDPAA